MARDVSLAQCPRSPFWYDTGEQIALARKNLSRAEHLMIVGLGVEKIGEILSDGPHQ